MGAIGLTFLMVGFVFVMTGNVGVGISFLGTGLLFFFMGAAAARKAASPNDSARARPPIAGDSGRAEPGDRLDGGGS